MKPPKWLYPLASFSLLLLVVRGARLGSQLWSNAGFITLNGALTTPLDVSTPLPGESYFQQAIQLAPENRAAWRGLGFVMAAAGQEAEALAAWQHGGDGAVEFVQWGRQTEATGQHEVARLWYERAIQVAPVWAVPWFYLGQVEETAGNWAEAVASYERAILLHQPQDADLFLSTVYYRLGMVHQWVQHPADLSQAMAAYETAVSINNFALVQEKADSYTRMGQILQWRNENLAQQITWLQTAVAIDPSHSTPYVLLGYAYFLQSGDVQTAEQEIEKALTLFPEYTTAYWYLGEIYRQTGMAEKALAQYTHLLTLEPQHSLARQRLAEMNQVLP